MIICELKMTVSIVMVKNIVVFHHHDKYCVSWKYIAILFEGHVTHSYLKTLFQQIIV